MVLHGDANSAAGILWRINFITELNGEWKMFFPIMVLSVLQNSTTFRISSLVDDKLFGIFWNCRGIKGGQLEENCYPQKWGTKVFSRKSLKNYKKYQPSAGQPDGNKRNRWSSGQHRDQTNTKQFSASRISWCLLVGLALLEPRTTIMNLN